MVGSTVEWVSQARGTYMEKTGVVVAVVPPNESVKDFVDEDVPDSRIMCDHVNPKRERVLVKVMGGRKNNLPYFYTPYKSKLKKIGGTENE